MKIVLVDDHTLFRVGVRHVLATPPGFEVIGEASTARSAFRLIDATVPDLVLMDIALPGMDGVLATREIGRRAPRARVLIVSAHDQVNDVLDALDAGAAGYALKSDGPGDAGRGDSRRQQGASLRGAHAGAPAGGVRGASAQRQRRPRNPLAPRAGGLSTRLRVRDRARHGASELCIARKTVDSHLNRINRKLGLRNMAELVRLAANLGMLHSARDVAGPGAHAAGDEEADA